MLRSSKRLGGQLRATIQNPFHRHSIPFEETRSVHRERYIAVYKKVFDPVGVEQLVLQTPVGLYDAIELITESRAPLANRRQEHPICPP